MTNVQRYYKHFIEEKTGSSMVEFTISSAILFLMAFGILEGSRLIYLDHYVGNAARDGARYAMVRGSTWKGTSCSTSSVYGCMATSSDVQNYVLSVSPAMSTTSPVTVTATWPGTTASGNSCNSGSGTNGPSCLVKVNVEYQFSLVTSLFPIQPFSLSSTSSVTIMQ